MMVSSSWIPLLFVASSMGVTLAHASRQMSVAMHPPSPAGMVVNCSELYFEQQVDHFTPSAATFQQRYFLNDDHYRKGGPMFFYFGHEGDVTLYVNSIGLVWENAQDFGALVVFAEHRYYGKSQLFPDDPLSNLSFLSTEQAVMDYVALVSHVKSMYNFQETNAVIGFGGSYGGMLATWGRFKYPHIWDGCIASSAPILSFEGMNPPVKPNFYAEGVTYNVGRAAGASEYCERNLRKVFANNGLDNVHPSLLRSAFHICPDDDTFDFVLGARINLWINDALNYMSLGNIPYASTYILNGKGYLPPFPVRVACEYLAEDMTGDDQIEEWLAGLASFAGVYYNYTSTMECYNLKAPVNEERSIVNTLWGYQYCSQIFQVFGQTTDENDMFSDRPWDGDARAEGCKAQYGIHPDRLHMALSYGNPSDWARHASNIVWSQGEYDPWRGGGVVEDLNDSLIAFVIEEAAHHVDLFFSNPYDTDALTAARKLEMENVRKWIREKQEGGSGEESNG